jgi:hypothetical protein
LQYGKHSAGFARNPNAVQRDLQPQRGTARLSAATKAPTPTPDVSILPNPLIAEQLGETFSLEYNFEGQNWVLMENFELQVTEDETKQMEVEVVKYSANGKEMTIVVGGEEVTLPIVTRQTSGEQEAGDVYTLLSADQLQGNDKYFWKSAIRSSNGEVKYYYSNWGYWVENVEKTTADGKIVYNPAELFAGLFEINEGPITVDGKTVPASEQLYDELVERVYNFQILFKNRALLGRYQTLESFRKAAEEGEALNLILPVRLPPHEDARFGSFGMATPHLFEDVSLDKFGLAIDAESREHILDQPAKKDPHFEFEANFETTNTTASLLITIDKEKRFPVFHFKRGKFLSDTKVYPLLTDQGDIENRLVSAGQMIESFLFFSQRMVEDTDFLNKDRSKSGTRKYPPYGFAAIERYNRYGLWKDSPYIQLRQ